MSSPDLSPSFKALASLSGDQLSFLRSLPKAELHAHLNGCIPIAVLQKLAAERTDDQYTEGMNEVVKDGLAKLEAGVTLDHFQDFFALFPAIYHLTSTHSAIRTITQAVLSSFLSNDTPTSSCTYLELRTTPRANVKTGMTRRSYLETVIDVVDEWNARPGEGEGKCRLIVSVDMKMGEEDLRECVELAGELKRQGRKVVGVDLCGDPSGPISPHLIDILTRARNEYGLPLTLHLAELPFHRQDEVLALLALRPKRIGHGTFLSVEAREVVLREKMTVEVCLSSNVLCKTTPTLEESHLLWYLERSHPVTICTDDTLPFRTSLMAEYALLVADAPLGLAMKEEDVHRIAAWGVQGRFEGW